MTRFPIIVAVLLLPLAGCADPEKIDKSAPDIATAQVEDDIAAERAETSLAARPVLIGEGGPRFDACQNEGRVKGLRGGTLPVRNAPFDRADQVGEIAEGRQVHICTRSLDQQWLGVVIMPAPDGADSDVDCGVSSPVRAKRNYDGPCDSGWIESNYVQLIAG